MAATGPSGASQGFQDVPESGTGCVERFIMAAVMDAEADFPVFSGTFQALQTGELLQMRLDGDRCSALRDVGPENLRNMSLAVSGRHHRAIGQGIFDMQVDNAALEQFPGFQSVLSALDKVGWVKDTAEPGECLEELQAAGGVVALDAFLILVAEADGAAFRIVDQRTETVNDFAAVVCRIGVFREIVGEKTDVAGTQHIGDFQGAAEFFFMGGVIAVDHDLGDR